MVNLSARAKIIEECQGEMGIVSCLRSGQVFEAERFYALVDAINLYAASISTSLYLDKQVFRCVLYLEIEMAKLMATTQVLDSKHSTSDLYYAAISASEALFEVSL